MERRFTEKQVAEVIRRATEIQAGMVDSPSSGSISETNLREAAREIGLDASVVAQAISQIDETPPRGRAGIWGGPLSVHSEVAFQGEVTAERWEEIVADIRKTLGETGEISTRGTTYEWTGTGGGMVTTSITVTQNEGNVKVSAYSRLNTVAFTYHTLGGTAMLMTNAVLLKYLFLPPTVEVAIGLGVVGSIFAATRGLISGSARRNESGLYQVVSRIRQLSEAQESSQLHGSAVLSAEESHLTNPVEGSG